MPLYAYIDLHMELSSKQRDEAQRQLWLYCLDHSTDHLCSRAQRNMNCAAVSGLRIHSALLLGSPVTLDHNLIPWCLIVLLGFL